jgi:hypothetical protein
MKSHWITTTYPRQGGLRVEHTLLTFTDRTPIEAQDTHLALMIGELDPFVAATEAGEDVVPERVQWVLDWAEAERAAVQ